MSDVLKMKNERELKEIAEQLSQTSVYNPLDNALTEWAENSKLEQVQAEKKIGLICLIEMYIQGLQTVHQPKKIFCRLHKHTGTAN